MVWLITAKTKEKAAYFNKLTGKEVIIQIGHEKRRCWFFLFIAKRSAKQSSLVVAMVFLNRKS